MSTSHIDWRWSASPLTILGLHYSVLVFFLPLLFSQLSWYVILAFALYCAFLVWWSAEVAHPMVDDQVPRSSGCTMAIATASGPGDEAACSYRGARLCHRLVPRIPRGS